MGAGVDFFFEGKSQPNIPRFFGLGVASAPVSAFAEAPEGVEALLDAEFAASLGPLSKSDGLMVASVFFSAAEDPAGALSVGDASWAQTSAAQALMATTVGRMERVFGMVRDKGERGTLPSRSKSVERKRNLTWSLPSRSRQPRRSAPKS